MIRRLANLGKSRKIQKLDYEQFRSLFPQRISRGKNLRFFHTPLSPSKRPKSLDYTTLLTFFDGLLNSEPDYYNKITYTVYESEAGNLLDTHYIDFKIGRKKIKSSGREIRKYPFFVAVIKFNY